MKNKRSRLARVGILALALSVVVGLASGGLAEAKKKGAKSITVVGAPTAIPAGVAASGTSAGRFGFAQVPLTVGKKAKGKVVSWDSVTLNTTFTGNSPPALGNVFMELTAPNGRTVGNDFETRLINPVSDSASATTGNLVSGPLTETPDSPFKICLANYPPFSPGNPQQPPCADPTRTVGPPYAGTVGSNGLVFFNGVPARGTWLLKLFNFGATPPTTATLNAVSLSMTLKKNPPAA